MELKILGPGFGAEVCGVGLAQVAVNDEAYSRVRAAFRRKPESALPLKGRDGREMDA